MQMIRFGCLLLFAATTLHAAPSLQPTLFESRSSGYVLTCGGSVVDEAGASLTLSAPEKAKQLGTAIAHADATPALMRLVTLSGELHTTAAAGGASLWIRVDAGKKMLMLENGARNTVRGDAGWTPRTITLPVPPNATEVFFGVMLLPGGDSVEVRHLRLTVAPLSTAPPSPAAQKLLDEAISIVRKNALRANDVDWSAHEPEIRAFAAGAEQTSDVYVAIRYVLTLLNDGHSSFLPPAQTKAYAEAGADNPTPELRATKDIGYIAIPGYAGTSPTAGRAYALRMFAALQQAPAARCGWIIDLRTNSGGNMYPMLNGLEPFLGDQTLGFFIRPPAKFAWPARHSLPVTPPPQLMPLESAWVAVITGPRTASSGEIVAIAFRGRPHTRSFGQPTAGLTTGNEIFKLSDGSSLALTASVDADRTGRVYGGKLDPDEVADDSAVMEVAGKWLRDSSGCDAQ